MLLTAGLDGYDWEANPRGRLLLHEAATTALQADASGNAF